MTSETKAKYNKGDWVKFQVGKRTLSGSVVRQWFAGNYYSEWIYDIARNKQTFRDVREGHILEEVSNAN